MKKPEAKHVKLLYRKPVLREYAPQMNVITDLDEDQQEELDERLKFLQEEQEPYFEVNAHFDLPANDPKSLKTGHIVSPEELASMLLGHLLNDAPLPPGYSLKQAKAAHNHLSSQMSGGFTDALDVDRLPIWEGNTEIGPWGMPRNAQKRSKPSVAKGPAKGTQGAKKGKPNSKRKTLADTVRVMVKENGHPSTRLAMRFNVPWSDDLKKLCRKQTLQCFLSGAVGFYDYA